MQPPDLLNLHPGPAGERSVVRWTAPAAGTYTVSGRFQGLDTVGYGNDSTGLSAGIAAAGAGGGPRWLVADHRGPSRMVVDQTGGLSGVTRHDYLPFGEELAAGTGGRTQGLGYAADGVRQKFTGYERDDETGLDYAQARYFASAHGRFTAVDPLLASGVTGTPQTWNRYSYALNNPLRFTDPSGMNSVDIDTAEDQKRRQQE